MIRRILAHLLGLPLILTTCTSTPPPQTSNHDSDIYRVMFYNVENLFDVLDEPQTDDDAFTPTGKMGWTHYRYYQKINNIGKVVLATGGGHIPAIIGLCEIENRKVLNDLVHSDALVKTPYHIVHFESNDRRGIDVALLYNSDKVRFISSKAVHVTEHGLQTRDILYCKVLLLHDTIHFFVNHWPSRSAGQLETERDRYAAARSLKATYDSIQSHSEHARIVIMGDFNDDPADESISQILGSINTQGPIQPKNIYNLAKIPVSGKIKGTLKYQGTWNLFDQIMVSGYLLLNKKGSIGVRKEDFRILENDFLLEPDRKFNGFKPYRTYMGFKYHGGFSDHLPVFIDLYSN
jgi:predicted extracellular nuclease